MSNNKGKTNTSDLEDQPPSYQEAVPPFNPQYEQPSAPSLYPQQPSPMQMPTPVISTQAQYSAQGGGGYQTIQMPATPLRVRRRMQLEERRKFPLGALFFLFGFFCPPLWIVGACCCSSSRNEYEAWWAKVNFVMSMILIIASVICSAIAASNSLM
ncbi:hypothetical protein K501DRAFT_325461 [Backusella circina FSU 941]|nr:hypothetical protein K501DRAFT_325461 [Backusella circina FSU 941]